jgi:hypothetical protein
MKSKSGRHSHSGAPPMFNPKSHDAEHRKNPGRVSHAVEGQGSPNNT